MHLITSNQVKTDLEEKVDGAVEISNGDSDEDKTSVINNVLWQMDNDRKTKALKQLQGHIWRSGYKSGKLVGHIYEDVKDCLQKWTEDGKKIYVYSSGSVEAQKLLFGSTKEGDLLSMFSGYFDTTVGAKTEADSYNKILEHLKESGHVSSAKDALFLTDIPKEAKAAAEAGLEVVVVMREGNAPLSDDDKDTFPVINSFCDLIFEGNVKRRKLSDEKIVDSDEMKSVDKKDESKDVEMEVCPSDSTEEKTVDCKSEEAVKDTKVAEDSTENAKVEDKVNEDVKVEEKKDGVKESEPEVEKMECVETKDDESKSEVKKDEQSTNDNSTEASKTNETGETKPTSQDANEKKLEKELEKKVDSDITQEKTQVENGESDKKEKDLKTEADKVKVVEEKKTDTEVKQNEKPSEEKTDCKVSDDKTEEKKVSKETNGEVKPSDEKPVEAKNGTTESDVKTTESVKSDDNPKKIENETTKTDAKDMDNGKADGDQTVVDGKNETKTDSNKDDLGKDKVESNGIEKIENGEPQKETDSKTTETAIKTNGTHKENGVADEDKNGVADEKVIKEKTVDKTTENGVETAANV